MTVTRPGIPAESAWSDDARSLLRASFREAADPRARGYRTGGSMIGALNANDRDSVGQFVAYLVGATGTEMGSQPNGPEQFMSYIESLRDNLVAHFAALMDANEPGGIRRLMEEKSGEEPKWLLALAAMDYALRSSAAPSKAGWRRLIGSGR